ncbi:hypothetical protein ACLOJK_033529 [Asimina triloba]
MGRLSLTANKTKGGDCRLPSAQESFMELFYALLFLLTALLPYLFLSKIFQLGRHKEGKKKKGSCHPIVTTVFHFAIYFGRLHDYMTELARKNKTFRLFAIDHCQVFTTDPANVEYILRTNFPNFGKGPYNYDRLKGLLGDGIFAVDGEKWRHQRKIASLDFSTNALRDFSSRVFQSNGAKVARFVLDAASSNRTMDIQDVFMKSTLDSIFKVAFGTELDTLYGSRQEGIQFAQAFDESSALILWRYVDPSWKIKKFFSFGSEAMLKKKRKVIDDFVFKLIRSKKEQLSEGRDSCLKWQLTKEDMLVRFLVQSAEDPERFTDEYLRDIILNFVIAGKDTTAATLSWFVYMLCKHPAVQEKIGEEVKETTQAKDWTSIEEFSATTTEEALNKMHYLHAVLTETLRLYPAVPVDGKYCVSDDTLPDGFDVKRGDLVAYVPYAMGRMKFIWGEDADVFRPERWIGADGTFQPESPFKFTAFQAGPRICLGKEFAYRQMKIFAAVLLRFFRFKLADENKPVKYKTMINLHIDQGLHVRACRA